MRLFKPLFGMFIIIIMFVGCKDANNSGNQIVNADSAGVERIPVMWVYESDSLFQPTFGNITQKRLENLSNDKIQMDASGLTLIFTLEDTSTWIPFDSVDVSILNQKNEVIYASQIEPQDQLFRISAESVVHWTEGETYYLDVQVIHDEQPIHYYLSFLYVENSQNRLGISYIQEAIDRYNKEQGITPMGTVRTSLESNQSSQMEFQVAYVGAKRGEEGFEYLDVFQRYHIDFTNMEIEALEALAYEKQRYYYSKQYGGWYLGDLGTREDRKIVQSPNERFQVIYGQQEAYLYDQEADLMYEVYRLDHLNSDYIYDESLYHGLHIFEVSNKGEVYFAVYGYIQDETQNYGKNGIAFYSYSMEHQPILSALGMIEQADYYTNIEQRLDEMFYYNTSLGKLNILYEQSLYQLDYATQSFSYIETFIEGRLNGERGLIYWDETRDKYLNNIFIVDLSKSELKYTNLYELGSYKHLLKEINGQIFVGEYAIENTYEYLDGSVVFPYHTIKQYNQGGELVGTYQAQDYGRGHYFSSIYWDASENVYKIDLMTMNVVASNNYKNSRVNFIDVETSVNIEIPEQDNPNMLSTTVIESGSEKESRLIHAISASRSNKNNTFFEFRGMPPIDVYVVTDQLQQSKYFTSDLADAFIASQDKKEYTIDHWKYNVSNHSGELTEIFNNNLMRDQVSLDRVVTIAQRPELPRGCEVTALSILLNYYTDQAPTKLTLADQLKVSKEPYEVINGFVHFSDMHLEFSGSMSDTSKPGLGVHIKPVQELAEKYVSNRAKNVTGITFEQMLALIAEGSPVLIITPNRYEEVLDHSKEVWKTPSGFMEVTYQLHSVVVMGFDQKNIYYSDPSTGKIDRKARDAFRRGWESMGSQAMIIVD